MRISPETRYKLVFWFWTALVTPVVVVIALVCLIPTKFGYDDLVDVGNVLINRLCIWRNNIKWVREARERADLFDILKE